MSLLLLLLLLPYYFSLTHNPGDSLMRVIGRSRPCNTLLHAKLTFVSVPVATRKWMPVASAMACTDWPN